MFDTEEIVSIPVVADVDDDNVPEVVVNLTKMDGGSWPDGNIAILDGLTGIEALRILHNPAGDQYGSHGRSTIAVGDVSGDGVPDIVYASREMNGSQSLIVAVNSSGALLWKSHATDNSEYFFTVASGAITVANFDNDAEAEVVIGAALIDHDGLVVWDQGGGGDGSTFGSNDGYIGGISAIADLDNDDVPEIISGRDAWKVDWLPGPTVSVTNYWTYNENDGYPAVVDLDGDGDPEVILVASNRLIALNGQTGMLWCGIDPTDVACLATPSLRTQPLAIPGGSTFNRGGPPTVADFDGDTRPEVGVAGGWSYTVFDFNRDGEVVSQPPGDPPAAGAIFVKWSQPVLDLSSSVTGSSAFDFQGDGAAEVLYADECNMRVFSGVDGTIELDLPNSSTTIHEYPLVVDVDVDGDSEILVVATARAGCPEPDRHGLYVYSDLDDLWMPTRPVWGQHTYHVTNTSSTGNVPDVESDNWLVPGLNTYRHNVLLQADVFLFSDGFESGDLSSWSSAVGGFDLGPVDCRTDLDCRGTTMCNMPPPGGVCLGCATSSDCPSGFECSYGSCARMCVDDTDCNIAKHCMVLSGLCAIRSCTGDGDCPGPYVCGASNFCERPSCGAGESCPLPLSCLNGYCVEP